MNAKEKFDSLNERSAWAYTKQKANFEDLYNSAKLFDEIPDIENANVEDYFSEHYAEYGISTDRHRILAIAQMFGLITKDSYSVRGGSSYSDETTTPVFSSLKRCAFGTPEFYKIFSEQLIKIKVKSIIDTTDSRDDYKIYPFLFLFLVMWKLDKEHAVKEVSMDKLWTYVLTCKSMDDLDDAVEWMVDPSAKISPYVSQYKSDSRFMTVFLECTNMFSYDERKKQLSLNHPIADRFHEEFVSRHNLSHIKTYLDSDTAYKNYLENIQGFNFDLTDHGSGITRRSHATKHPVFKKKSEVDSTGGSEDISVVVPDRDTDEIEDIIDSLIDIEEEQEVKEANVYDSEDDINKSNNREPVLKSGLESNHRYSTDPRLAKTAIKKAEYVCELSGKVGESHSTFESVHGTKYLEAHHLIPMKAQKDYVSLGINLDRLENIVALCPNCHKAVHYGTREEKVRYLKPLYDSRIKALNDLGIEIDFDVLIDDYYK